MTLVGPLVGLVVAMALRGRWLREGARREVLRHLPWIETPRHDF